MRAIVADRGGSWPVGTVCLHLPLSIHPVGVGSIQILHLGPISGSFHFSLGAGHGLLLVTINSQLVQFHLERGEFQLRNTIEPESVKKGMM
jgi:hypothetical protein